MTSLSAAMNVGNDLDASSCLHRAAKARNFEASFTGGRLL
jgi:hypothetical protein